MHDFVKHPGSILNQIETLCSARSFMPNHSYLLVGTGAVPLATVMRRLLTGHGIRYSCVISCMVSFSRSATNRFYAAVSKSVARRAEMAERDGLGLK